MSLAIITIIAAVIIALAGTLYAWLDFYRKPHRYGYRVMDRRRELTGTDRGVTRAAIRDWSAPSRLARGPTKTVASR